jgi:hypothetical protein
MAGLVIFRIDPVCHGQPAKLPDWYDWLVPPPKLRGAARQFALGRTRPLKMSVASSLGRPDSQISANAVLFVFRIATVATRYSY